MKKFLKLSAIVGLGIAITCIVAIFFIKIFYKNTLGFIAAADTGNIERMKTIVSEGYDPQQKYFGENHLRIYFAIKAGSQEEPDVKVVTYMLKEGISPNVFPQGKASPLYFAIGNGSLETVAALLEAGANPNSINPNGMAPLDLAVRLYNYEAIPLLLKYGAKLNKYEGKDEVYQNIINCSQIPACLEKIKEETPKISL